MPDAPTTTLVYLNGEYLPREQAAVSVFDRGLLFGEGVYEVVRYYAGFGFTLDEHAQRLQHSLEAIDIEPGRIVQELKTASDELVQREGFGDAKVYWQVTRGVMDKRSFAYSADTTPTVFAFAAPAGPMQIDGVPQAQVYLANDDRWANCWIKTTMLMPNTIALNAANQAGCEHAVLARDGVIREANSANLFLVKNGELITYPADGSILGGITRSVIFELIDQLGLTLQERSIEVDELYNAEEALITGSGTEVTAITGVVDGIESRPPAEFEVGPITTSLRGAFVNHVQSRIASP